MGRPFPHITATVTRNDCTLGFDWDEWMQTCVKSFVGRGTGTGGGGGTGGTGGSGGGGGSTPPPPPPPPEIPECSADQIAIADEYNDPVAWPCEKFTHGVIHGDGTHGHATGYLTDSYISGSGTVLGNVATRGVTGATITSNWRCPEGNKLVGGEGLTHVHGRAGDFWAPGFLDEPNGAGATIEEEAAARELHAKFAAAAQAAGGRYTAFGHTDGTHKDHIHIFW